MYFFAFVPPNPADYSLADFFTLGNNLTNGILGFSTVTAIVAIVWAGVKMTTSSGNDEQVAAAKNIIKWALIGLAVILLAWAFVGQALKILQVKQVQYELSSEEAVTNPEKIPEFKTLCSKNGGTVTEEVIGSTEGIYKRVWKCELSKK